jgi:hypothetical protein
MRHPPIEQLRAFAVDESTRRHRRRTATHLAGCADCREKVAWVRELRVAAAEAMTLPAPAGAWEQIRARNTVGGSLILPLADLPAEPLPDAAPPAGFISTGSPAGASTFGATTPGGSAASTSFSDVSALPPRRWGRSPALRAAVLVLGLAGVASATVPGSPLRAWIDRVLPLSGATGADALETGTSAAADPGADGISAPAHPPTTLMVPPVDGALTIRIERPHPELRIRVRLGEESDLLIQASGGAAGGRFRTGAGRLTIEEAGEGEVVIGVPAGARRVSLEVDGRVYMLKEAGLLQILVPVADTVGSEFVFSPGRGSGAALRP